MRIWPDVEPADLNCPALLLAGTENKRAMDYITTDREALDKAGIRVEVIEGLTHQQEFSRIEQGLPIIASFLGSF